MSSVTGLFIFTCIVELVVFFYFAFSFYSYEKKIEKEIKRRKLSVFIKTMSVLIAMTILHTVVYLYADINTQGDPGDMSLLGNNSYVILGIIEEKDYYSSLLVYVEDISGKKKLLSLPSGCKLPKEKEEKIVLTVTENFCVWSKKIPE